MQRIFFITLFSLNFFITNAQESFKIMTYNIRLNTSSDAENQWNNRKEMLSKQILYENPAIFGVQEALPEQVKDLKNLLPNYNFIGIGRDENGTGEASNIYYDKIKYKVLNSSTFWLSETPEKVSKGWDAAINRICTYGLFQNIKTKKTFYIFNTHFDHIGNEARKNSAKLILEKIQKINNQKIPFILIGDFNGTENTEWIQLLSKNLIDSKNISNLIFGPNGTFNGFQYDEIPTERIDYIFVSPRIKVKKYATLIHAENKRFPSDHFPVITEIEF